MIKILTVYVFTILCFKIIQCVVFTGTYNMEKLLKTQTRVNELIEGSACLLRSGSSEEHYVVRYLEKSKQEQYLAAGNPEHYLGNPINALTLITRLTRDLKFVEQFLNDTTYKRDETLIYPSKEDVAGAIFCFLRLQMHYGLKVPHLANGTIFTNVNKNKDQYIEHVSPMTASDCFDLGVYADDNPRRNLQWLEEAYRLHKIEDYFYPFTPGKLMERISEMYYAMGDAKTALDWLEQRLILSPGNREVSKVIKYVKRNINKKKRMTAEELEKQRTSESDNITESELFTVCRGDGIVNTQERLSCYYVYGPHPFLRLAPIKAELLYKDPDILMIYDLMSDAEIARVKSLAKNTLRHGRIVVEDNTVQSMFEVRTSDVTWLPENEDLALSRRIEQFTGLHVNRRTAELLQVANYGIGGHFAPHFDFYHKFTVEQPHTAHVKRVFWQRAATVLIYMSNVEQGGATAFPKLGLSVFPVKNAALFWMNVDPWCTGIKKTEHTACPVLRGAKWVASKWIILIGQELKLPCPVQQPNS